MHYRYFSVSDCSIRVSRSFVQFLCPLHKNGTYYASILLFAFTQPLCQKFCWRNRRVPNWGPPTDIEQYVQEIGRAGRDGKESLAILMFEKANRFTKQAMRIYAECKTECRRKNLFGNFIQYIHNTDPNCKCCDMICDCTICTSISF